MDDGTADTGGAEETIEIEVECEFSVTYAHRRLVLVARGCNDLAMKLGTRSPTDKQTIFHQFCVPDTQLSQFQVIGEEPQPRGPVVKQHAALLELIGRALDLHHEPNENPRFNGASHKSDIDTGDATSQGQDDEEEMASVVEPMQKGSMWDSKRVAYFLALCCLAPANVYAFNPTFFENCLVWHEEEWDLNWHLNSGMNRDDPRQRLVDQLDLWADPDQEWKEIVFVF
ncbi:uncharacterized protein ACA1_201330 [Acanthamoeba castellanii str. Neff]|uniref:Uncharacterized protein n=1 Tax=Acanthamoeba castellanii (strain ATCC 30010 / Neff) TaxID=1257118 RepID=L8H3I4_ACACF|nr:uncharacterized protein ACA1_201330 [Acanthamoeba castellanii str. Neff]ELR19765.1 hypothetical protein ACA1_201330 [Acanthamoeba castellanii str. Neff]